jgi:CubicO group peptidase (beta-lactamase class C family)
VRPFAFLGLVFLAAVVAAAPATPHANDGSAALAAARRLPQLQALIASHRGRIVLEYYATGRHGGRLGNVKSVSKSIIAALVGVAIERKLIAGVREPIARWFPELLKGGDQRRRQITIEDLLTMRSGLESTSGPNYGPWVTSRHWVRHVLERPMVSSPGTSMEYSTGSSHLLSAILTKATGRTTYEFAVGALAKPLGITLARWPRDPQGIYFGGNDMLMSPRQMIAIGELWLNDGRVKGVQVVPAAWVETSCQPRTRSRWDPDREYGYGWWSQALGGYRACFAWGFGGQYILVIRELGLVIAVASTTAVSDERHAYRQQLLSLIETQVLPLATR